MKLQELIESTNIPETLVRAVVRQAGGWESFEEAAPDIARHGIDGGFHGFIYHTDTLKFAKKNRASIAELAESQASDFGMGVLEMIQGFRCLGIEYSTGEIARCLYGSGDDTQILNAFAWYAGEETARAYADMTE